MYQRKIDAYQRSDVLTADPLTLVILCYNSAISNLKIAQARFSEHQFEAKTIAISKALDIIGELMSTLNFETGGDIAKNLNAIYQYALQRISYGDIHKDMSALDEVITILESLREAWKTIGSGKGQKQDAPPAPLQEGMLNSTTAA